MESPQPSVKPKANTLEKIIVNFALPTDFIYHTIKQTFTSTRYSEQSYKERLAGIAQGKITKIRLSVVRPIPNINVGVQRNGTFLVQIIFDYFVLRTHY